MVHGILVMMINYPTFISHLMIRLIKPWWSHSLSQWLVKENSRKRSCCHLTTNPRMRTRRISEKHLDYLYLEPHNLLCEILSFPIVQTSISWSFLLLIDEGRHTKDTLKKYIHTIKNVPNKWEKKQVYKALSSITIFIFKLHTC